MNDERDAALREIAEAERGLSRDERILRMVRAPDFQCYPSNLNSDRVVVIDGRTGCDACERSADDCFDVLLEEIDGEGSPNRLGFAMGPAGPTFVLNGRMLP